MDFVQCLREWALVIGGVGAFLTALAALTTILFTRRSQLRERKDTLRREILKWATEINEFALAHRTEATGGFGASEFGEFVNNHKDRWLFEKIEPARSRSVYTEEVALKLRPEVRQSVVSLREALSKQIALLHDLRRQEDPRGAEAMAKDIAANNSEIHSASVQVIRYVAKAEVGDL